MKGSVKVHSKSTKDNQKRNNNILIVIGCIVIAILISILINFKQDKQEELIYIEMIEIEEQHWQKITTAIEERKSEKEQAEQLLSLIKADMQEIQENVDEIEVTLKLEETLAEEAEEKVTRFVPDEVAQIYEEANLQLNVASEFVNDISAKMENIEANIAQIEKAYSEVKRSYQEGYEKGIFLSKTILEETYSIYLEAENLLEEVNEKAEYSTGLLVEIEELENQIKTHLERAQNFDIMSEISLLSSEEAGDVRLLAQLIFHEAGICSDEEQYKVACVVMNRTVSDCFPDTVYGVIYDTKHAKQYGSTGKFYSCEIPESVYKIAYDVYINGVRVLPENIIGQTGFKPSTSKYTIYEVTEYGHYYFSLKE